ncbi:hypothetical protein BC826DRAFT_1083682 [Russula brevipes]|nr:hypothetical protein BC826DRAFT_1083682 [Russula brevipes]
MSLVFSLSAALAATLVQQWVREYVHVFQRYNHPLKCARIRQFLYEGADRWHMDVVVNLVPALIHISLFLFFIGLADFLFKINIATATTTTMVIVICALGYLFSIVAPVWDAQSPYQSPLSGMFWHLFFRTIGRRTYKGHSPTGQQKRISTNMTEGRVQLAMDDSGDRKNRDAHAIKWVVDDLTEDSELEPLVRNIPDSFNSKWGKAVWEIVAKEEGRESSGTLSRLNVRMARLLRTCTDPGAFPDELERERRARACIGASLSLVLSIRNAQLREAPTTKLDSTSGVRWTCMSMIVVCKMFQTFDVRVAAERVINSLAEVRGEREGSKDDKAAKTARPRRVPRTSWVSANSLHQELIRDVEPDKIEDRLRKIVREKKDRITTLDDTWNVFGWAEETDKAIVRLVQTLREATEGTDPIPSHLMPQFIPPRLLVQRLWLCVSALRRISKTGWGASIYAPKRLADLSAPELSMPKMRKFMDDTRAPMQTQLLRLQDLRDGGLVYTLELFIESIKSSSKAILDDSSRELYGATFLAITRKWKENRHAVWTERLLVDLLRRVLPANNDPPSDQVPEYIIDRFLTFLADVLKGKEGSHVQNATSLIKAYSEGFSDPRGVARDVLLKLESRGTGVLLSPQ